MDPRSTRCISQVFDFLKDPVYCEHCETSNGGPAQTDYDNNDLSSQQMKKSASDTKILESHKQSPLNQKIVRKCLCHIQGVMPLDETGNQTEVLHTTAATNTTDSTSPNTNDCEVVTRRQKHQNSVKNRTNTEFVSQAFRFLHTHTVDSVDFIEEGDVPDAKELCDVASLVDQTSSNCQPENHNQCGTVDSGICEQLSLEQDEFSPLSKPDSVTDEKNEEEPNRCEHGEICDRKEISLKLRSNADVSVEEKNEESEPVLRNGVESQTKGSEEVVQRRRSSKKSAVEDLSDDSSDEDAGVYAESFRNSTWIRVDDNGQLELPESISKNGTDGILSQKSTGDTSPRTLRSSATDDVFCEGRLSPVLVKNHKRSDSSTTTLSENEFKRQYTSRRKCLIQRNDSQQEYHRFSAKFYDQEKVVIVEKKEKDLDFGLHILDSHPAFITSIDPASPAARAGVQEGQILIGVNGVTVLESTHDEIVKLIQQNSSMVKLEVAYSDFQPVRDLQAPIMAGYMYKLGNSALVKTWKKRYFVLRKDNCLYYYKSGQEIEPLGAIPLSGYSILRYIDTSKEYCFKADKYGARTYYFMTDSRDEMTQWVGKLTESAHSKKRKDSWLDVSSHNVGLPALEIRRPESTGYLVKMGQQHKTWKRRYCVLKDACIYYYKSMNSFSAQGVAHLHGYTVDAAGISGKRHSFILRPPEESMRTFHFCAENETDKQRWVEAMIRSIQRWIRGPYNS